MTDPAWTVVFAAAAVEDLVLIEAHLAESYRQFGEGSAEAAAHSARRIDAIIATAERLATAPERGEAHEDLLPGLRHLSLESAIYWFVTEATARQLRILAIFFGGQDHRRHMLIRLLRRDPE